MTFKFVSNVSDAQEGIHNFVLQAKSSGLDKWKVDMKLTVIIEKPLCKLNSLKSLDF